jgi:hypothetical protein
LGQDLLAQVNKALAALPGAGGGRGFLVFD